jgi:hypothetical protein
MTRTRPLTETAARFRGSISVLLRASVFQPHGSPSLGLYRFNIADRRAYLGNRSIVAGHLTGMLNWPAIAAFQEPSLTGTPFRATRVNWAMEKVCPRTPVCKFWCPASTPPPPRHRGTSRRARSVHACPSEKDRYAASSDDLEGDSRGCGRSSRRSGRLPSCRSTCPRIGRGKGPRGRCTYPSLESRDPST